MVWQLDGFQQILEEMMSETPEGRRKFLQAGVALGGLGILSSLRPFDGLIIREAHALDPVSIFAIANTAISVVRSFSSQAGDGGLNAMLNANLQYQRVLADQVNEIQKSLLALSDAMSKFPAQFRDLLEDDRIKGYYVDLLATMRQFDGLLSATAAAGPAERNRYQMDIDRLRADARLAGTRLAIYPSLLPAIAAPLAVALEVALNYKSGQPNSVPVALRNHIAWCKRISDPSLPKSVAANLVELTANHDRIEANLRQTRFGKQQGVSPGVATIGCVNYGEHERIQVLVSSAKRAVCGKHGSCDPVEAEYRWEDRRGAQSFARRLLGSLSESANKENVLMFGFKTESAAVPAAEIAQCANVVDKFLSNDAARQSAIEASPAWNTLSQDAASYADGVSSLNNLRIQMAANARVLVVITQSEQQARNRLIALGLRETS